MSRCTRWLIALLACIPLGALAHKPSDSYLRLGEAAPQAGGLRIPLRWDVALRDLDRALSLDADGDGRLTWGEVLRGDDRVRQLLASRLGATLGERPCAITVEHAPPRIIRHSDGAYAVHELSLACPGRGPWLHLEYTLLFDVDPQHRGLLRGVESA